MTKLSIVAASLAPPGSLTLAWDPSSDPSVVGYRLYQGTASQIYSVVADIGNTTTATISGLSGGVTYFFAVTAYDATGLESAFSGEISYTVPLSTPQPPNLQLSVTVVPGIGSQMVLFGSAPLGSTYQILATQDFKTWTLVGTVTPDMTGAFQFTDTGSPFLPQRFYRLVLATSQPATKNTVSGPVAAGALISNL